MKNWYYSKTLWLAALQFAFGGVMMLQAQYPEIGVLLLVKSVLDIFLRFLTSEPLKQYNSYMDEIKNETAEEVVETPTAPVEEKEEAAE